MQAMIFKDPPQRIQIPVSVLNARLTVLSL